MYLYFHLLVFCLIVQLSYMYLIYVGHKIPVHRDAFLCTIVHLLRSQRREVPSMFLGLLVCKQSSVLFPWCHDPPPTNLTTERSVVISAF